MAIGGQRGGAYSQKLSKEVNRVSEGVNEGVMEEQATSHSLTHLLALLLPQQVYNNQLVNHYQLTTHSLTLTPSPHHDSHEESIPLSP